ncbi:MAG: radical SAM protein [bacterium]
MRIILLYPPSPFLIDQKAFPPLGILYLAGYARAAGHEVEVYDLAGKENDLKAALSNLEADIFGISATTPQYPQALRILAELRKRQRNALMVIGGAHPSSVPEQSLADGFDTVVVGEGEVALVKVAEKRLLGIVKEPYIKDLDDIPRPARDMIDIRSYGYSISGGKATTIITSRGCPHKCSFCSKNVWQRGTRFHSSARIMSEIRECMDKYGFKHFLFLDDSLTLRKQRLMDLCKEMEPLGIVWRAYVRADAVTREMLVAMKLAGCVEVGIGIESGSQQILDAACKGTTVEQNSRLIALCREVGILSNVFIMIGLPGESYETVEATRRWMEENRPDKFGYNIFTPYVGTPIRMHPEMYDLQLFPMPEEESWVKGRQGEYHAFIATSKLSREEILRLFAENFKHFEQLIKWRPGVGKIGD